MEILSNWLVWLIIAVLLVIVEMLTNMLAALCLAVGCIVAMVAALCGCSLTWQIILLSLGVVVAFVGIVPFFKRYRSGKEQTEVSNMDAVIGRVVNVIAEIPANGKGRVKVDGDNWQAVSKSGEAIAVGTKVRVLSYDSIVLTVEVCS